MVKKTKKNLMHDLYKKKWCKMLMEAWVRNSDMYQIVNFLQAAKLICLPFLPKMPSGLLSALWTNLSECACLMSLKVKLQFHTVCGGPGGVYERGIARGVAHSKPFLISRHCSYSGSRPGLGLLHHRQDRGRLHSDRRETAGHAPQ